MRTRVESVLWIGALTAMVMANQCRGADQVVQSPRALPVAGDVDVAVVGGTTGAVEAACAAARQGARVFLLAPRPYLGTDLCATLRLWLDEEERAESKLAAACFAGKRWAEPWNVKAAMDRALLEAGVTYLTGCYATDVLRDRSGQLAGVAMVNRSGRQAIRAKVIIDASDVAVVARLAGAGFHPFDPAAESATRVVIGGAARNEGVAAIRTLPTTLDVNIKKKTEQRMPVHVYTLSRVLARDDARAWFEAENRARDLTYAKEAELSAEVCERLPTNSIIGQATGASPDGREVDLNALRPRNMARLYVLSAYADLPRKERGRLLRPTALLELGSRVGRAAADEARTLAAGDRAAHVDGASADGIADVEIAENLSPLRAGQVATVPCAQQSLPVLGRYDVVVVGGGTAGAPAGIAAAKSGAKTLVLEYLPELGGVGTAGLIGSYWYGIHKGYTHYVDQQVNPGRTSWNVSEKAEWLRRELRRQGAEVWLGALACGTVLRNRQVCGVVVATPYGRGVVLAGAVVDATGNANLAAWANAPTEYGIAERGTLNVQIAGFPERPLRMSVVNTCYTMVDDTDVLDVWHLMTWRRTSPRRPSWFDVGQLIDSRERRRIVGDYTLSVEDILAGRRFPDTISQHYSNFDAAAFPDSLALLASDAKGPCFYADMPYRCLLPQGLDGMLVVGLGASAHRDAMTLVRMQPDLQNQGYAAGMAASMAARAEGKTRSVDVRALQRRLVAEEVLEDRVLTDVDSFPLARQTIAKAVQNLGNAEPPVHLAALAVVLTHRAMALPLLQARFAAANGAARLETARILGLLGDATGAEELMAAIDARRNWDQGSALTSQRKTGNIFSELDRMVIALGFSRAPQRGPVLLRKAEQLAAESELSHYKALSLALWDAPDSTVVPALTRLLDTLSTTGTRPVAENEARAAPKLLPARLITADPDAAANQTNLNRAMKQLLIAALIYRCDRTSAAAKEVLAAYAADVHGHFARYAQAALDGRWPSAEK